jgi:hypothetical protein
VKSANRLFKEGKAACRDEEGLWRLWKRNNVYKHELAWTKAPSLNELSVKRAGGRHQLHHSREFLFLAENEDVEGVELATMDTLVDQIRNVASVVYKGKRPAESPVYTMEQLNLKTFDLTGHRQRHQECAKSIADALGGALIPCNMLSEAKLHFCVKYPGMTRAVPITTARGSAPTKQPTTHQFVHRHADLAIGYNFLSTRKVGAVISTYHTTSRPLLSPYLAKKRLH